MLELEEIYWSDIKFWLGGNSYPVALKGHYYYIFDGNKSFYRCNEENSSIRSKGLYFEDKEEGRFLMELEEGSFYA
jgi:hypothetical protein